MSSEIKVDTISENTSANGVAVDSVILKDGAIDVQGVSDGIILDADGDTTISADTDDQIDIKVGGTDVVKITAATLDVTGPGNTGGIININNTDTEGASTDNIGRINFVGSDGSSSASGTRAAIETEVTGNFGSTQLNLEIASGGAAASKIATFSPTGFQLDGGKISTFGESAPDAGDGGITLQQGSNDDSILTMKSTDIAHSITSRAEADTYCFMQKSGSGDGGLQINGINDTGNVALQLRGLSNGGEDTGKGTGDHGCVRIDATSRTSTTTGSQGANVNMVTICNNNTVRFIFDAEGDLHSDSSNTTFDAYEDAQLVRAYDLSHGKGVIASKFDDFIKYNQDDLTDAGLVGKVNHEYNTDGTKANPLINMSGFMRLHNGAIWQQYEKHQRLANAMYELAKAAVGEDKANEILKQNDIKLLN